MQLQAEDNDFFVEVPNHKRSNEALNAEIFTLVEQDFKLADDDYKIAILTDKLPQESPHMEKYTCRGFAVKASFKQFETKEMTLQNAVKFCDLVTTISKQETNIDELLEHATNMLNETMTLLPLYSITWEPDCTMTIDAYANMSQPTNSLDTRLFYIKTTKGNTTSELSNLSLQQLVSTMDTLKQKLNAVSEHNIEQLRAH